MSTFAYAQLSTPPAPVDEQNGGRGWFTTSAREGQNDDEKKSATQSFIDALAALVPIEVLTLHAAIISVTTAVDKGATSITHPMTVRWSFFGLLFLTTGIYVLARRLGADKSEKWEWRDNIRMFIPALAFVGWTMLQRTTAFDAVLLTTVWDTADPSTLTTKGEDRLKQFEAARTVIALFLAVVLGLAATALGYKTPTKPALARRINLGIELMPPLAVPPVIAPQPDQKPD